MPVSFADIQGHIESHIAAAKLQLAKLEPWQLRSRIKYHRQEIELLENGWTRWQPGAWLGISSPAEHMRVDRAAKKFEASGQLEFIRSVCGRRQYVRIPHRAKQESVK